MSITESVDPPRSAFVDYPLGHTTGRPGDLDGQVAIVRAGLSVLASATEPGQIVDLGLSWSDDQSWRIDAMNWRPGRGDPRLADERSVGDRADGDVNDSRVERHRVPQYQTEADRLAAEQISTEEQCRVCIGLQE